MEISVPDQLSALAHPTRLDVFRLLMRRYPNAVPAGEIASVLSLKANTASVYLSALRQAGLISQTRRGTFQLYRIEMDSVQAMFGTLMSDCCQNRPQICMGGAQAKPSDNLALREGPISVLFVCSHNSARSIMAEALLRQHSPRFSVHSAGTSPAARPNPDALAVLQRHGIPIDDLSSQSLDPLLHPGSPQFDLVITVCDHAANQDAGLWPGAPLHAHWSVPDPFTQTPGGDATAAMEEAFLQIRSKISALTQAPETQFTPMALQLLLDDIGADPGHNAR